ncbi:hypothetical protein NUW54_g6574 [Trametes sanguinea]|uniref:Uncharacterized protein n=1 Tax=Trametes sanguinea TaxID=158606 RepID=A0ACC1PRV7_9APHY|nr:hypothetical protein NUW54_g6574 [Trametes sanguinea]
MHIRVYYQLPVIGTLFTGLANVLFAVIDPAAPYWAFDFPAAILSVFGADFVFATGTLFVAKVCLPHEQSVGGALFQTLTQVGTAFGIAISTIVFDATLARSAVSGYGVRVDKAGTDVDEKVDSGYTSSSPEPAHDRLSGTQGLADGDSTLPSSRNASSSFPEGVQSVYVGMERGSGRLPSLSKEEVLALADRFASIIPPRTFSMATLQGYLMAYKIRPLEALADAPAWGSQPPTGEAAASGCGSVRSFGETSRRKGGCGHCIRGRYGIVPYR